MKKSVQAGGPVNAVEYRFSKYKKDMVTRDQLPGAL
jgi:hypothetical protein